MEALSFSRLALIIATLIFLGCVNFTMLKQMYTAYGGKYAFFVNQGVNLLYIVYGGAVLYPRMIFTNVVTPEMKKVPKTRFLIMGILDAFGTFFTAMGAAYTPGSFRQCCSCTCSCSCCWSCSDSCSVLSCSCNQDGDGSSRRSLADPEGKQMQSQP